MLGRKYRHAGTLAGLARRARKLFARATRRWEPPGPAQPAARNLAVPAHASRGAASARARAHAAAGIRAAGSAAARAARAARTGARSAALFLSASLRGDSRKFRAAHAAQSAQEEAGFLAAGGAGSAPGSSPAARTAAPSAPARSGNSSGGFGAGPGAAHPAGSLPEQRGARGYLRAGGPVQHARTLPHAPQVPLCAAPGGGAAPQGSGSPTEAASARISRISGERASVSGNSGSARRARARYFAGAGSKDTKHATPARRSEAESAAAYAAANIFSDFCTQSARDDTAHAHVTSSCWCSAAFLAVSLRHWEARHRKVFKARTKAAAGIRSVQGASSTARPRT